MEPLMPGLLTQLQAEFSARDPAFFARLQWPWSSSETDRQLLLACPELSALSAQRREAAIDFALARFQAAAPEAGAQSMNDELRQLWLAGIADALLATADSGVDLPYAPLDVEHSTADFLAAGFDCKVTDSGRFYLSKQPGVPLVIVNALGIPLRVWQAFLTHCQGWQVILPELTCGPLLSGGMHSDDNAASHARAIFDGMQTLHLAEPAWVLGWCNGGRIALELARLAQSQQALELAGLVLLCPTFRESTAHMATQPERPAASAYENKLQQLFAMVLSNPKAVTSVCAMLGKLSAPMDWQKVPDEMYARTLLGAPRQALGADLAVPMSTPEALLNYARRTAADETFAAELDYRQLDLPVYLIQGSHDPVVANPDTRWWLQQRGVAFQTFELHGAGHIPQDLQAGYVLWLLARLRAGQPVLDHRQAARWPLRIQRFEEPAMLLPPSPSWALDVAPEHAKDYALGELFAYGQALDPNKVAIGDGKRQFTFGQLAEMSERLAHWLAAHGVGAGTRVPILAEKNALMPVLAAAIWRLGAVYVPLDGQMPDARLRKLLARLNAEVVLSIVRPALVDTGRWLGGEELANVCSMAPAAEPRQALPAVQQAREACAYIIFTSGSTGEPKGVEISVGSLKDYFRAHNEVLRFGPDSRVFSLSPFHFDVSIEDTLLPLSLGAYVYQFASVHAGAIMRAVIVRERITHLIAVSTLLSLITEGGKHIHADNFPALSMVMTGAEICDPKVINLWKRQLPHVRLINAYGPTETTIVCFCYSIEQVDEQRSNAYPIGTPLRGVNYLLLAEDGQPLLDDAAGELCVGGSLVMRGYLDQLEETAKVIFNHAGTRYYRTGDICRRQADGQVLYIGRRDDEVKIAGRRIHLGEIRQQCLAAVGVERAALRVIELAGKKHIAVVLTGPEVEILPSVEQRLREQLPSYMVPTLLGWAQEVSLSSTGKTDERALLEQLAAAIERCAASQPGCRYFIRLEGGAFLPMNGVAHESPVAL